MSSLTGDWDKFRKILNNLQDNQEQYKDVGIEIGHKIAERIWDILESQQPSFAPLAEEYRKQKIREGWDERITIRTGEYLNSIKVLRIESSGDSLSVFIGVEGGKTETGLDMTELAKYLEYGTSRQPARYPITQSWEIMKNDITRECASRLKSIILGDMR